MGEARRYLNPLPLYRKGNRGRGFAKHFPCRSLGASLTTSHSLPGLGLPLLGLVGLPGPLKRGRGGTRWARPSGFGWGSPDSPSHCHLPNQLLSPPLPASPRSRSQHPSSRWGHPVVSHRVPVTREAVQEAGANLEKVEASGEATGRGEKREEKELLMHIMSAELGMTN